MKAAPEGQSSFSGDYQRHKLLKLLPKDSQRVEQHAFESYVCSLSARIQIFPPDVTCFITDIREVTIHSFNQFYQPVHRLWGVLKPSNQTTLPRRANYGLGRSQLFTRKKKIVIPHNFVVEPFILLQCICRLQRNQCRSWSAGYPEARWQRSLKRELTGLDN